MIQISEKKKLINNIMKISNAYNKNIVLFLGRRYKSGTSKRPVQMILLKL